MEQTEKVITENVKEENVFVAQITAKQEIAIREYVGELFSKDVKDLPIAFKEFTQMLQNYCAWKSLFVELTKK